MKELIKPSITEEISNEMLQSLGETCDLHCTPPQSCNKHCTGQGTTNSSPTEETDILF
jgi:hypothetical protein